MEIFLDTANIAQIRCGFNMGILKGVTTNPSILLKNGEPRDVVIKSILDNSNGILFVQTTTNQYRDIMDEANELLNFDDNRIGIKIPITKDGIKAIKDLKNSQVKTLATAVFTTGQAILSAVAGADYVAPYINRMEQNGIDSIKLIKEIRHIYEINNIETKILAASFRNVEQIIRTVDAGAHAVTISYELLCDMFNSYLTDISIKKFAEDWTTLNKKLK